MEDVTGESQLQADDALRSLLSFRVPGRFQVCSKSLRRRNRFKTEAPVPLLSIEDARKRATLSLFGRALAVVVEVLAAGQWCTVLIASESKATDVRHEVQMRVREALRASIHSVGLRVEAHLADKPQPFTPSAYSRLSQYRAWQRTIQSAAFFQSVGDLSQLLSHR